MEYIIFNLQGKNGRKYGAAITEITQIGAVRVNEKLDVQDTFHRRILPEDQKCFADVLETFRLWCGDSPLVTWGEDDAWLLEHSISANGLNLDWMPEFFDAREIFEEQMNEGSRTELNYAMILFGLKPRAVSSALTCSMNTVSVLKNLSFAKGISAQSGLNDFDFEYEYDYDNEYDYELA